MDDVSEPSFAEPPPWWRQITALATAGMPVVIIRATGSGMALPPARSGRAACLVILWDAPPASPPLGPSAFQKPVLSWVRRCCSEAIVTPAEPPAEATTRAAAACRRGNDVALVITNAEWEPVWADHLGRNAPVQSFGFLPRTLH
jgi:hypothetical protein